MVVFFWSRVMVNERRRQIELTLAITCPQKAAGSGSHWATGSWRGRVRCTAVLARPLCSEHRLKNTQQLIERSLRQSPQLLDETFPIYSSQLISHNVTVFTIKRATHSKRVWMTASGERRNDESA